MKIWDELNHNLRKSTKTWVDWARTHAQDIGEAGMRHIERQDLLSERKSLVHQVGELVTSRMLIEEKKTVRHDTPGMPELLERLGAIDERLDELAGQEEAENDTGQAGPSADA